MLLFPLAESTEASFAWTIEPPLTAAFLGAAYWAAFVLLAWSAAQRDWDDARAALPPVTVIAVLLLVTTLVHYDRFDMDSLAGPFWLVTYCVVSPLLIALVWRQLRIPAGPAPRGRPLPPGLRALLALQGAVMLGVGAALLLAPAATADDLWAWTLTPLTARAVGSFVTGFGVAALQAAIENDRARFRGAAYAYLALGLLEVLAGLVFAGDVRDGEPQAAVYRLFVVSVVVAGAWGVAATRASAARAASGSS